MADRRNPINVLIVEDSSVARQNTKYILESDPELHVMGMAEDGEDAVRFVSNEKPDVITMDVNMPKMDGLAATRRIMETNPTPIVIVSASYSPKDVERSFNAIKAGAVAVVEKPVGPGDLLYDNAAKELILTVKLMSEVKVVKRWSRMRSEITNKKPVSEEVLVRKLPEDIQLVVIGASTGGPPVLHEILSCLTGDVSAPILVVQHIAKGFLNGLVEWLGSKALLPVHIASHGERILPGHIYIAPDGFHMGIKNRSIISLSKNAPENGIRPSVSYLFRSAIDGYGGNMAGILLTGMGRDGADELCIMKEMGAITIAQDKESSVVHGMPGEAIKLGGATHVLPPAEIAVLLKNLLKGKRHE